MWILSIKINLIQTIHMKCKTLFSRKKKRLSALFFSDRIPHVFSQSGWLVLVFVNGINKMMRQKKKVQMVKSILFNRPRIIETKLKENET